MPIIFIENFWRQAKRTLSRYNGLKALFYLKDEWRFNFRPVTRLRETLYNWVKEAGIELD